MFFWEDSSCTTQEIARKLLGCLVVKETEEGVTSGFIVETEAYLGEIDQAAHSYRNRRTPRLTSMYKKAGTIYIYQMHMQHLLNLVVKEEGVPEAILIRAIEPFEGIEIMESRRMKKDTELTNGPGKLTIAMGIDKSDNGKNVDAPPLLIDVSRRRYPKEIVVSKRIGIPNKGKWTDAPLRYAVKGNPYVSKALKKETEENFGWNLRSV